MLIGFFLTPFELKETNALNRTLATSLGLAVLTGAFLIVPIALLVVYPEKPLHRKALGHATRNTLTELMIVGAGRRGGGFDV
jgi:uncharacterized membrane protein YqjE